MEEEDTGVFPLNQKPKCIQRTLDQLIKESANQAGFH